MSGELVARLNEYARELDSALILYRRMSNTMAQAFVPILEKDLGLLREAAAEIERFEGSLCSDDCIHLGSCRKLAPQRGGHEAADGLPEEIARPEQ